MDRQRAGVTAENNGAIPFWQAMWPGELSPEDQRLLLEELGMDEPKRGLVDPYDDGELRHELMYLLLIQAGLEDARQLIEAYDAEHSFGVGEFGFYAESDSPIGLGYEQSERLLSGIAQPWTAAQIPPLAEWVAENEQMLDLLVEAGNRPKFYSPSPSLLKENDESLLVIQLPTVKAMRQAVRLLRTRALLRIAEGRRDDAWRDLIACYGLAEHMSGQGVIVQELVSIACAEITNEAVLHLMARPDLPDAFLREVLHRFSVLQSRHAVADSLDWGERLAHLDTLAHLSYGNFSALGDRAGGETFNAFAFDWNIVFRDANQWYDRLVAAGRLQNWQERKRELDRFDREVAGRQPTAGDFVTGVVSRKRRSNTLADILDSLLLPAMTIAFQAEDRANAGLELTRLAVSLADFKARRGEYPEKLDALVPDVLDRVPVDMFNEKPFYYERTDTGYLLYSFGPNGQDDGGCNEQRTQYKGYAVVDFEQSLLRELLGEPAEEPDSTDLRDLIPAGADDHAIRLPMPVIPLPMLVE